MKNQFNFSLTGIKFLPIWLVFLFAYCIPYAYAMHKLQALQTGNPDPSAMIAPLAIILFCIIAVLFIAFFITKTLITNVQYKETNLEFEGKFGSYAGKALLHFFLSVITLGIYTPWFYKKITAFFSDNTKCNGSNFSFKGKGLTLLGISLATLIVPIMIIAGISFLMAKFSMGSPILAGIITQVITYILIIPFMYLLYKWLFDFDYKGYHIAWQTEAGPAIGKIFVEMALTIITMGIYSPLAGLRLYKYFTEKTVAVSEEKNINFHYDLNEWQDFLFMWGQILLTIVTCSIYYPWAISKIGQRILSKTYTEVVEA